MELHQTLNDSRKCTELLKQSGFEIRVTRATEWFDEIWFQRSYPGGAAAGAGGDTGFAP